MGFERNQKIVNICKNSHSFSSWHLSMLPDDEREVPTSDEIQCQRSGESWSYFYLTKLEILCSFTHRVRERSSTVQRNFNINSPKAQAVLATEQNILPGHKSYDTLNLSKLNSSVNSSPFSSFITMYVLTYLQCGVIFNQ